MSDLDVLIVGASIAGPVAAYWFAKAGAKVTIIERFPELRTSGQSIDIRTAGVTVMRRMSGMEEMVRAKATHQEGVHMVRQDGSVYATIKASGDPDKQTVVSDFEIFRGDLSRILYDLTKDNERIKYIFGEQVESIQQAENDGPALVAFKNGHPKTQYDLVVACDGATSRTRAIGFTCGARDHIIPLNCWAAYFSMHQDLLDGTKMAQLWSTTGGRFIGIGPDSAGVNRIATMAINPRGDDRDLTAPFRDAMKQGEDALKRYVAAHFRGAGWKTDTIVRAMVDAGDFYASEIVQVKTPRLSNGRFVLVGDAGYCPSNFTGAGTTLAIAGAYTLAGEIAAAKTSTGKTDIQAALKAYEARMRPLINEHQQIPRGMPGLLAPQTDWGIWLRNLVFGWVIWSGVLGVLGRFFSGMFGSDRSGLPEYKFVF